MPASSRRDGGRRAVEMLKTLGHCELCCYVLLRLARHHVKAGDQAAAGDALHAAHELEPADWPPLLRMRRLRLRAFLESNAGAVDAALLDLRAVISSAAREGDFIAEEDARSDLADVLWAMDRLHEAAIEPLLILDDNAARPPTSVVLAMACDKLIGVLCELGQAEAAVQAARQGLAHMRRSTTRATRLDNMVCLMCVRGRRVMAARLLGASDAQFADHGEGRGQNEHRGVSRARQVLESGFGVDALATHGAEGAPLGEEVMVSE